MADGYLERRMEDYLAGKLKPAKKKTVKKVKTVKGEESEE